MPTQLTEQEPEEEQPVRRKRKRNTTGHQIQMQERYERRRHLADLEEWTSTMLTDYTDTGKMRLAYARLHNPVQFRAMTLMLDGHDCKAAFQELSDGARRNAYTVKHGASGIRTQCMISCIKFFKAISESIPANLAVDKDMFVV